MAAGIVKIFFIVINKITRTIKIINYIQTQPSRSVLKKSCSENMQQIYRRTPMRKCNFNKVARVHGCFKVWHGCSPVNLLCCMFLFLGQKSLFLIGRLLRVEI